MTIVGYNVQVGGVQVNDALIAGPPFTLEGWPSGADLGITITTVDAAGYESVPSVMFPASTLATVPVDSPLSLTDRNAVDAIVAASMVESSQPGVIVSITGPRGYYSKAYGNTAATGGRPLTIDDHFRMGSVCKTFTATAFWMALDQGLVSLDDTLDMYVAGVPSGNLITIRDMMQMRSGVYDYQSNFLVALIFSIFPTYMFSEAGALQIIKANASQFTPGTSYAYTNSNYVLLGAVVEAVDPLGRKIKNIITEDILTPLGMTETQWPSSSAIQAPAASASAINPELFGAAGALTSTVGDLTKWAKAMRDGTLISDSSRNLWHEADFYGYASGMSDPPPALFGYGLGMISLGTWLGHDGSVPGFSTACVFDSVSGATISVSENAQTTAPVVLAAWTRIFHSIGAYLYPGSMVDQNYTGKTIRPASAVVSVSGGVPNVSVNAVGAIIPPPAVVSVTGGTPAVTVVHNKVISPASAVVSVTGGTPGSNPIVVQPASAVVSVTGGTPAVTVTSFSPFTEENLNRINRDVPAGAIEWRFRALGAGAGGGGAYRSSSSTVTRAGGGGGGGGALVDTGWQSVSVLGPTYSASRGIGGPGGTNTGTNNSAGTTGTAGGASVFTSGSVSLTANGGSGGGNPTAGSAGIASVSGITGVTTASGTAGGAGGGGAVGSPGVNNTAGAGAGGGGGGGRTSSNVNRAGGVGGNSTTGTGGGVTSAAAGSPGPDQSPGDPGPGGGGGSGTSAMPAGGDGGNYGGGGGGQAGGGTSGPSGGTGGDGYTLIEWR